MLAELSRRVQWLAGLLDFAFPPLCLGCGAYCESEGQICDACFRRMATLEYPICLSCGQGLGDNSICPNCDSGGLALFAYGQYHAPLTEIILQFKFKGITTPARVLGQLLAQAFAGHWERVRCDCLVPVPLHPGRENRRGYNQALLLADELGELLSVPVVTGILYRARKRHPQSRLSLSHREANIRGVFELIEGHGYEGRDVVIVDDVVTSGSTVKEVARVLRQADIRPRGVLALAYGGGVW